MDRRGFLQTSMVALTGMTLPALFPQVNGQGYESVSEVYVAVSGSDGNLGTREKPFASLERAKLEVRERRQRVSAPITVWVRGGTYYFDVPLILEAMDSGTVTAPIIYASYPGEVATLSGARKLNCRWEPYKDEIMKSPLPLAEKQRLNFTQLFINSKRRIRARYPNYDARNPLLDGAGYIEVARPTENWPPTEFHYDPQTFTKNKWKKPQGAVVHLFPMDRWGNLQWEVRDVDWSDHAVKFGWGGFQINELLFGEASTGIGKSQIYSRGFKSRFFIENVFEELDAPGEWYLDRDQGMLFYIPEPDQDLAMALVEAPVLERLIEFRGSQRRPVQGITFSGFRVAHTASTFLNTYEAPSLGDWTIHRGGAVFFEGAEDCGIVNTFFDAVGGNGVFLNNYNRRIQVYGNKFTEAGDSAICLVGSEGQIQGTNRPIPSENLIANNLIHDCGIFGKQVAGVFLSITEKNTISHNRIFNMPRSAICINDGWGGGHIVEFNHIHDTVRETTDHGSFNSWGRGRFWCMQQSHGDASHRSGYPEDGESYPFSYTEADGHQNILRNNLFQESPTVHQLGIDLDDGSSHYHIYNNICIGVSIKLREGDYRVVENNIFFNPANPPAFHQGYEQNHDRFLRNIIVTVSTDNHAGKSSAPGDFYQVRFPPRNGRIAAEMDCNLFFNDLGSFSASITQRQESRVRYSLEQWRQLGYDQQSIYADPEFVDPEKGNYSLRPQSRAFRIGFKEFDLTSIGLLDDFPKLWLDAK